MNTYECYQPEYVSRFKCDGQKCSAKCCRGWNIFIDKKTYKKYSHIKPKSTAQEITRHIAKREGKDEYVIKCDENLNCPFLTADNWCSIQRKYGEEFLSEICMTYPRHIFDLGNYRECSLTLSCPVAAELILLEKEPLKFEKITKTINNSIRQNLVNVNCSLNFINRIMPIQETAITILQDRNLTIDQRLMILGLYCDKLDELIDTDNFEEFEKINAVYQDTNFLQDQVAQFSAVIKFNAHNHIKIMIELLNSLYGKDSGNFQGLKERRILDAITNLLNLPTNENEPFKISEVALRYSSFNLEIEKFLSQFSAILENYILNEFFMNMYPFRFKDSKTFNYGVFVMIYKMLELITFSMFMANHRETKDLIEQIMWYATNTDHNQGYLDKISGYMKDKRNILEIIQNMLQV